MTAHARTVMPVGACFLYPCEDFVAGAVRAVLKDFGRDLGFDPYDAQVCVSELIANAVVHAPVVDAGAYYLIGVDLGFDEEDDILRIGVRDWIERPPVPYDAEHHEEFGRGLVLIEALSERWGVTRLDDGKVVWCELRMHSATGRESPTR